MIKTVRLNVQLHFPENDFMFFVDALGFNVVNSDGISYKITGVSPDFYNNYTQQERDFIFKHVDIKPCEMYNCASLVDIYVHASAQAGKATTIIQEWYSDSSDVSAPFSTVVLNKPHDMNIDHNSNETPLAAELLENEFDFNIDLLTKIPEWTATNFNGQESDLKFTCNGKYNWRDTYFPGKVIEFNGSVVFNQKTVQADLVFTLSKDMLSVSAGLFIYGDNSTPTREIQSVISREHFPEMQVRVLLNNRDN